MQYPPPLLAEQIRRNPELLRILWQQLSAAIRDTLWGHGRVYGGGMHKLAPKELATVPTDALAEAAGLDDKRIDSPREFAEMFLR